LSPCATPAPTQPSQEILLLYTQSIAQTKSESQGVVTKPIHSQTIVKVNKWPPGSTCSMGGCQAPHTCATTCALRVVLKKYWMSCDEALAAVLATMRVLEYGTLPWLPCSPQCAC